MATPACLRLYKYALESIFAHLNLRELARISATCRNWSAAVDSMRPIGARTGGTRSLNLRSICASRLIRHVSTILIYRTPIIVSDDVSSLCDIVKQSKSLTTLSLWNNSISNEGASAIAEAVKKSASLSTLSLCKNSICAKGASRNCRGHQAEQVAGLGGSEL